MILCFNGEVRFECLRFAASTKYFYETRKKEENKKK